MRRIDDFTILMYRCGYMKPALSKIPKCPLISYLCYILHPFDKIPSYLPTGRRRQSSSCLRWPRRQSLGGRRGRRTSP